MSQVADACGEQYMCEGFVFGDPGDASFAAGMPKAQAWLKLRALLHSEPVPAKGRDTFVKASE